MHADELLADRPDEQGRHHGGIHAAGEGEKDLLVAHLGADRLDLLLDEGLRELGGGDARHVVGTLAREIHACSFERGLSMT